MQTWSPGVHLCTDFGYFRPIEAAAAGHWATLRDRWQETGRRINVNDLWIAAVALGNGLPIVTQDADFDALEDIGGPKLIRV
ncbi:MAG: ribonuclease [Pseudonocardiales bacterium]|nr:ribonuclease [Pseudonocardiales bacterium]